MLSKPNETQLVTFGNNNKTTSGDIQGLNSSQNTQNNMQMYRENPVGMFMGANLNNRTININLPSKGKMLNLKRKHKFTIK